MRHARERGRPERFRALGFVHWFRADLGITIATGISSAVDQSGTGNTVTQGTGSAQPSQVLAAYNGRPAARFSSVSSQFLSKANVNLIGTGPYSVFHATRWNSGDVNMAAVANSANGTGLRVELDGSSRAVSHSAVAAFDDGTFVADVLEIWSAIRAAASKPTFKLNGATQALSGAATTIVDPGAAAALILGARNDTGAMTSFIDGDICEVCWYTSAASDSVAARLNHYMGAQYAVAA